MMSLMFNQKISFDLISNFNVNANVLTCKLSKFHVWHIFKTPPVFAFGFVFYLKQSMT